MVRKTFSLALAIIVGAIGVLSESNSAAELAEGAYPMVVFQEIDVTLWYVMGDEDQTLYITSLSKRPSDKAITVEVLSLPLIQRLGGPKYRQGQLSVAQEQQLVSELLSSTSEPLQENYHFEGTTAEHPAWLEIRYGISTGRIYDSKAVLDVYPRGTMDRVQIEETNQGLRLAKTISNSEESAVKSESSEVAKNLILARLSKNYDTCPQLLRPFLAKGLVLVGEFSEALLKDGDPAVRIYALWGLSEVSPGKARDYLTQALEDPDPSVREFAKEQLGTPARRRE